MTPKIEYPMTLLQAYGCQIDALSEDKVQLTWHGNIVATFSTPIAAIRYMNAEFLDDQYGS